MEMCIQLQGKEIMIKTIKFFYDKKKKNSVEFPLDYFVQISFPEYEENMQVFLGNKSFKNY